MKDNMKKVSLRDFKILKRKYEVLEKEITEFKKEYYYLFLEEKTLADLKKNHRKKMEKCISIYQYIENNPNSKRKDIIEGTELPEGAIKRYLHQMENSKVPYISREGKGPATTYTVFYKGLFGPIGKRNIQNLSKAIKEEEEFKNLCLKRGDSIPEDYIPLEKRLGKFRTIVEKGNLSILLNNKKTIK